MGEALKNDDGKVVVCGTCGCTVTEAIAKVRRWGTMRGKPQCSADCARTLYTAEFVELHYSALSRSCVSCGVDLKADEHEHCYPCANAIRTGLRPRGAR